MISRIYSITSRFIGSCRCFLFVSTAFCFSSAMAQTEIPVFIDAQIHVENPAEGIYNPVVVNLASGKWQVVSAGGAMSNWLANDGECLTALSCIKGGDNKGWRHMISIKVNGVPRTFKNQILFQHPEDAARSTPLDSGSLFFELKQPGQAEVYISDTPTDDNRGGIGVKFVEIKSFKDDCDKVGNPCSPSQGNKSASELDIVAGGLLFERSYNSDSSSTQIDLGLGKGWGASHLRKLYVNGDLMHLRHKSGTSEWLTKDTSINQWFADADSNYSVTEDATGFDVVDSAGTILRFSIDGSLISQTMPNGTRLQYQYFTNGKLSSIENERGHQLGFTWSLGRIQSIEDLLGNKVRYVYDAAQNLSKVVYPDLTPNDDSDNPEKIYHYEDVNFPNHLTGITDENGSRYATYAYDTDGKAISTEHAITTNATSQEKFILDYQEGQN